MKVTLDYITKKACVDWLDENVGKITQIYDGWKMIDGEGWRLCYIDETDVLGPDYWSHIVVDIKDEQAYTMFCLRWT